jgi:predicted ferric reductase
MRNRGIALLALLYLVLPLAQAEVYIVQVASQSLDGSVDWLFSFNYLLSITSYHWMLANVLLSLKVPLLQHLLPYDLRVRVHIYATMGITAMLTWHAVHTLVLNFPGVDLISWLLIPLFLGLVILAILWIPLPGLRALVVNRAYDFLKGSHKLLFLVLAAVSWWHVTAKLELWDPNRSPNVPAWSAWGYALLFALTAGLYLYTRIRERFLPELEVVSVVSLAGITRLTLTSHPRLRYHAGQFAFLRFQVPGLRTEEHPFSFTTTPHDDTVGFAIRELGDFTHKVAQVHPGDKVRVNAGFGSFSPIHRGTRGRPLALIGSGIGVAPLISILKDLGHNEPDREVVYLQAYSQREELLEPETVVALQKTMPNLKVRTYVYEEDYKRYNEELLGRELPDPTKYDVFLCSSPRVRAVVFPALRKIGVPRENIIFEAFNLG